MALLSVQITKGGASLDVDLDALPDAMYKMALAEGLKVMLNKRMSKVGSVTKLEGDERAKAQADAMRIAEENLTKVMDGTLTTRETSSRTKVAGVVMTEARRLAKEVVKNTIRAAGMKVSHVEASQITAAANELIASDPSFLEQAEAAIESRKGKTTTDAEAAKDLLAKLGSVSESPKLVARSEKEKAERKSQLSAKQASKVAPRKAKTDHHTAH